MNFYYNNILLENQFRHEIMMTEMDGKILELLDSGNIDEVQNMLSLKYDLELSSIETEWAIRGDSIYKDILYPDSRE